MNELLNYLNSSPQDENTNAHLPFTEYTFLMKPRTYTTKYSRFISGSVKILHEFKKCQAKGVTFHLQKTTAVQNYNTFASSNNGNAGGGGGTVSNANTSSNSYTNARHSYHSTDLKSSSGDQKDSKRSRSRTNSSNRYSQFDTFNTVDDPNASSPGAVSKSETLSQGEPTVSAGVHSNITPLVQEDPNIRGRPKERRRRSKRRRGMSLDSNSLLLIQHMNDGDALQNSSDARTNNSNSLRNYPLEGTGTTARSIQTSKASSEDHDYSFRDLISQISSRHVNQTTSSNDPEAVQEGLERSKTYNPVLRKVSVRRDNSRKQRTRVHSADDLLDCFVREAIQDSELQNQFHWRNTKSPNNDPESHKTTIDNMKKGTLDNDLENRKERRYQKAQQDTRSPSSKRKFAIYAQNRSKTPTISDKQQLNPMINICKELKEFNARHYDSKVESKETLKDNKCINNTKRTNVSTITNNKQENTQELMMQEKKVGKSSPNSNETITEEQGDNKTMGTIAGSDRLWMKGGNRREQQTQSPHKQSPQHTHEQLPHVPRQSTHNTEKESNEFDISITDNTCYTTNNNSSSGINKSGGFNINANNTSTGHKTSNIHNSYTPNHHYTHHYYQSQQNTSPQFTTKPTSHLLPEKSTNNQPQRIYTQGQQPPQYQRRASIHTNDQSQLDEPQHPLPDGFGSNHWNKSTPVTTRKQTLPYQTAKNASSVEGITDTESENIYRGNRVSSPKLQTTRRRKNSLQAKKQKEQKAFEAKQNQEQQIQSQVSHSSSNKIPSPPARIVQHHYQKYFDTNETKEERNYPKFTSQEAERRNDLSLKDGEPDEQERDRCQENIGMQCAELSTLQDRIDTVEQQIVQLLLLNNDSSGSNRRNKTDINTFGTEQSILLQRRLNGTSTIDSLRDNFSIDQTEYDYSKLPAPLVTSELGKALDNTTQKDINRGQFTIQHEIKSYYERIQQTTDQITNQKLAQTKLLTVIDSLKARQQLERQYKTSAPSPKTCPKCQTIFRYPKSDKENERKCLCTLRQELEQSKATSEAISKKTEETEAHISKVEQDIIEYKMRIQRLEYEIDYCYRQKSIQADHRSPEKTSNNNNNKSTSSQSQSQYEPHGKTNSSHYLQHRPPRVPLGANGDNRTAVKSNNYQPLIPSHLVSQTKQSNRPTSPRKSAKNPSSTSTSSSVKSLSEELSKANLTLTPHHLYQKNQRSQQGSTNNSSNQDYHKPRRRRAETDSDTGVGSMSTEEESSHLSYNQLSIASTAAQIAI